MSILGNALRNMTWAALAVATVVSQDDMESLSVDSLSCNVFLVNKKEYLRETIKLSKW